MAAILFSAQCINTLRPRQDVRHFADDICKCIFLDENVWIPIKISLTFMPKGPINNIPTLVQIMAWRRPGDKPLCEPMIVTLLTHKCVTRPQWVKHYPSVLVWRPSSRGLRRKPIASVNVVKLRGKYYWKMKPAQRQTILQRRLWQQVI